MAKSQPSVRVTLRLDPRVALEAILLNRLERVPATRRQEWLRGLLLQGFRVECQALRGVRAESAHRSALRSAPPRAGGFQRSAPPTAAPPVAPVGSAQAKGAGKPFAALGKVIG